MLRWLTKRWRFQAVTIVAVLYAVCVIAPSVAIAFTDGTVAAHCLDDEHLGLFQDEGHAGTIHDHADHGTPAEHDGSTQKGHTGSCCGLFCFVAIPGNSLEVRIERTVHASVVPLPLTASLEGRGVDRLIRPPINLLSL
jgi:hypothetical protein